MQVEYSSTTLESKNGTSIIRKKDNRSMPAAIAPNPCSSITYDGVARLNPTISNKYSNFAFYQKII